MPKDLTKAEPKAPVEKPAETQAGSSGGAIGAKAAPTAAPAAAGAPAATGEAPPGNVVEGAGGYKYEVRNGKLYIVQSPKHPGEAIRLPVRQANPAYGAIAAELAAKGVKLPVAPRSGMMDDWTPSDDQAAASGRALARQDLLGEETPGMGESLAFRTGDFDYAPPPGFTTAGKPGGHISAGIADDLVSERDAFLPADLYFEQGRMPYLREMADHTGLSTKAPGVFSVIERALAAEGQ